MATDPTTVYVPQDTTAGFFLNAYLDSHRANLERSIAMAQAETNNQMELLEYYRKQEQAYLKYLAKVKGIKGFEDEGDADLFKRQKEAFAADSAIINQQRNLRNDEIKLFTVPSTQVPLINAESTTVANNLHRGTASGSAVDQAIARSATIQGTEQAMASALMMYNAIQAADSRNATPRFAANENAIVQSLLQHYGLKGRKFDGVDAEVYFTDQQGFEEFKNKRIKAAEKKATSGRIVSPKDLLGSGTPSTTTTTEGTGSPVDTSYEELMLKRIQTNAADLEEKLMKATQAEAIFERGKEIYQNQFGGNVWERMGAKKRSKQLEEKLAAMPPAQRFFVESLESVAEDSNNPFSYREESGLEGDNKMAAELLNAMIGNKASAKPLTQKDFVDMAGKMAMKSDGTIDTAQQQKLLGLAIKGLGTYQKETNPDEHLANMSRAQQLAEESERLRIEAQNEALILQAAKAEEERKKAQIVAPSPFRPSNFVQNQETAWEYDPADNTIYYITANGKRHPDWKATPTVDGTLTTTRALRNNPHLKKFYEENQATIDQLRQQQSDYKKQGAP